MWNKSAKFLMVRVRLENRKIPTFPIPLYVVDELFEALEDLAWLGEVILRFVPIPQEERAQKQMRWVKEIPLRRFLSVPHDVMKDLRKYKGLEVVDVETGVIKVKVQLR